MSRMSLVDAMLKSRKSRQSLNSEGNLGGVQSYPCDALGYRFMDPVHTMRVMEMGRGAV